MVPPSALLPRDLTWWGKEFVRVSPGRHATATHVYRTTDWGGWIVLGLLAALFLGTGITIRLALEVTYPPAADAAVIVAGIIALGWAGFYYSLRVSAHAIISRESVTLVHGPWRHMIAWEDVVRVSEWTALSEGIRFQWMALWSLNGMRLQIREDLVGDFSAFRADVMGRLGEERTTPALVTDLDHPLTLTEDVSRMVTGWGVVMAIGLISGILIVEFLPEVFLLGAALILGGIIAFGVAVGTQILRQRVTIGRNGVRVRRGPLDAGIPWSEMYLLERVEGSGVRGALGILVRGLVMVIFRIDRRSVVVPGVGRQHGIITIGGGTGERMRIQELHFLHPEWIRARLRAEVAALHRVAAAPRVSPLPATGPLSPGTVLPPDPLESSTLWLRESMADDPYHAQPAPQE